MNDHKLEKRYGLVTAICMVVGIVIGSGVFYKAQDVLRYTDGNVLLGIAAWGIGALVMIICALNFANLGTRYEKVNGLVDYTEATMGSRYAYLTGWFATILYYPAMTSVLAWVSARYTLELFGLSGPLHMTGGLCLALACLYLCLSFTMNALAPKLAGKFQVGTTFVKLIPLVLMAVVGIVVGMSNGNTVKAFSGVGLGSEAAGSTGSMLFAAAVATAFAYEGWIIATTINSELKNAKRNLPIALIVGCIIIAIVYITYYIGLSGATSASTLIEEGSGAAFRSAFGSVGGTLLSVFVVVSCLGTLNGLMLASQRGMYSLSVRNEGPKPKVFGEVSDSVNMPVNSAIFALLINALMLFYFFGASLVPSYRIETVNGLQQIVAEPGGGAFFGLFSFDSSELPIITIYAMYIPVFVKMIMMHHKEGIIKNVVLPVLGVAAAVFMVFAAIYAHGITPYQKAAANGEFSCPVLFYLIIYAAVMIIGNHFYRKEKET